MKNNAFSLLLLALIGLSISFSACGDNAELKRLAEENAILKQKANDLTTEDGQLRTEYSQAIEQLNAIEDTLRSIAEREKQIQKLSQSKEFSGDLSQRQNIMSKLEALKQANEQANNQAKQLQGQVKSLKIQNENLVKMIATVENKVLEKEQQIAEQTTIIKDMRTALNKMEAQLLETRGELAVAYEDLQRKNQDLQSTVANLERTNQELRSKSDFIQDNANAYIVCGTKRQLRKMNIMQDLTKDLTSKYKNEVTARGSKVNLFGNTEFDCGTDGGNIDFILPKRDPSTYELRGATLVIKDAKKFWAIDRVVVLVKEKE
jgi:chromosome segregation ATPase